MTASRGRRGSRPPATRRPWSIAGRASRSSPPATSSCRSASRSARRSIPDSNGGLARRPGRGRRRRGHPSSASPATTSRRSASACASGIARGGRRHRQRRRVGRRPRPRQGGASSELGELDLWRVAVQPGKPLAFGRAPRRTATAVAPVRPAGQPGQQLRDLRALRAAGPPPLRRPSRPSCGGRDVAGRARRGGATVRRPARLPARAARVGRPRRPDGGVRGRPAARARTCCRRSRSPTGWRSCPRRSTALAAGAEVEVIRLDANAGAAAECRLEPPATPADAGRAPR